MSLRTKSDSIGLGRWRGRNSRLREQNELKPKLDNYGKVKEEQFCKIQIYFYTPVVALRVKMVPTIDQLEY